LDRDLSSFTEFSEDIDHEEQFQKPTASVESQRMSALKISIKREIEELRNVKEATDQLQIMQRVSQLQMDINQSFGNIERKRLDTKRDLMAREIRAQLKRKKSERGLNSDVRRCISPSNTK
jgi:hypothetical protein